MSLKQLITSLNRRKDMREEMSAVKILPINHTLPKKTFCYTSDGYIAESPFTITLVSEIPLEQFSAKNNFLPCACNQTRPHKDLPTGKNYTLGFGDPFILYNLTLVAKNKIPAHLDKFADKTNREIWLFQTLPGDLVAIDYEEIFICE